VEKGEVWYLPLALNCYLLQQGVIDIKDTVKQTGISMYQEGWGKDERFVHKYMCMGN
jgi:hypothetical protein